MKLRRKLTFQPQHQESRPSPVAVDAAASPASPAPAPSNEWRRLPLMKPEVQIRPGTEPDPWEMHTTVATGDVMRWVAYPVNAFSGEGAHRRKESVYPWMNKGYVAPRRRGRR